MNNHFKAINVVIVCLAVVVGIVGAIALGVFSNMQADHLRQQHELIHRAQIAECHTIRDEQVRALCVVGVDSK